MHAKYRRKFWSVVAFGVVMTVIALPAMSFLPSSVQERFDALAINLGLDLQGGLHLEYKLDLAQVDEDKVAEAKDAVQAAAERKVNAYGVGEPVVWISDRGGESYMIVEMPGVDNIEDVKNVIQKAPLLEFKEQKTQEEIDAEQKQMDEAFADMNAQNRVKAQEVLDRVKNGEDFGTLAQEFSQDPGSKDNAGILDFAKKGTYVEAFDAVLFSDELSDGGVHPELVETEYGWHIIKKLESRGEGDEREVKAQHILLTKISVPVEPYKSTGLTGEFLERADVSFGNNMGGVSTPTVLLQFDSEGKDLFAEITKRNLGQPVAIYLDGEIISAPTVQAEILDGRAEITGDFDTVEAKTLARQLNEGSLPVPFELVSQQSVEATLGAEALAKSMKAGLIGLVITILYMIIYYRFFGVIAAFALGIYAVTLIGVFKLSSITPMAITLTLAGIAGLILSVGMAVDANVLIFERIREELRMGKSLRRAIDEGFSRAWPSIRDGNFSTILTSVILMSMGTSFVKGFALILIIGVCVSMFTAIVLVRIIITYISGAWLEKRLWLIMHNKKK